MRSEIKSEIAGVVWKVVATVGQTVSAGDELIIIELMKMEIPMAAPNGGRVDEIRIKEGDEIAEGQTLIILSS